MNEHVNVIPLCSIEIKTSNASEMGTEPKWETSNIIIKTVDIKIKLISDLTSKE